jgi:CheY-like chemotaxis protein
MPSILIVDDDETVRDLIVITLKRLGHTVLEAANGMEAMTMFRKHRPDIIITDMVMPDRDGIETIMDLRREGSKIPIIAISGNSTRTALYLKAAQQLGALQVLSKPFTVERLRQVVGSVLSAPTTTEG